METPSKNPVWRKIIAVIALIVLPQVGTAEGAAPLVEVCSGCTVSITVNV